MLMFFWNLKNSFFMWKHFFRNFKSSLLILRRYYLRIEERYKNRKDFITEKKGFFYHIHRVDYLLLGKDLLFDKKRETKVLCFKFLRLDPRTNRRFPLSNETHTLRQQKASPYTYLVLSHSIYMFIVCLAFEHFYFTLSNIDKHLFLLRCTVYLFFYIIHFQYIQLKFDFGT